MNVTQTQVSVSELDGFPTDPSFSYNPTRSLIGKLADSDSSETDFQVTATQTAQRQPKGGIPTPIPAVFATMQPGPGAAQLVRQLAFNLKRKVGQGAFGEVWEATQQNLGRTVAVKRLRHSIFLNEVDRAAKIKILEMEFRQEALTTARLDHPNIVPVHDISHDEGGRLMIAMKLVRGTTWKKIIDDDFNTMNVQDFLAKHLKILVAVSQAVAFAHSRCVLHRDLKPQQVMVGKFGEVVLMDWGLSMTYGTPEMMADITIFKLPDSFPEVPPVNPAGTPAFMAPEQTDSDVRRIGPWTDIYLLGGTLFFLLTRTYPHFSADAKIAFELARNGEVCRPEERNAKREVPPELSDLCMQAMNPEPQLRMGTAEEFIRQLEEYLSGSGRRREARDLTRQAEIILRNEDKSYERLSECSLLLARATGLWPDNPEAKTLKQEVILAFAKSAMQNNDLLLAKLQAERIQDVKQSRLMLQEINTAQDSMREKIEKPHILTPRRLATLMAVQLISMLAIYLLVGAARSAVLEETKARAREIAVIVAGQVNASDLSAIHDKVDMDSAEFHRVRSILQRARSASSDVRNVYTLRPDPGGNEKKFIHIVNAQIHDEDVNEDGEISADEKGVSAGLPFDASGSHMSEGLRHAFVESEFAYKSKGTLLSAYAPVIDAETKQVAAILAVDIDANAVQKKMYRINVAGLVAGSVFLMLITGAMLASFRLLHTLHVNKMLDKEMRGQASQLQRGNISLS